MIKQIFAMVFLFMSFSLRTDDVTATALTVDKYTDRNMLRQDGDGYADEIQVPGTGDSTKEDFLIVVKNFINWVLGILALITLCILLWGGFQMVTAAGDDKKYDAGFTYVKQAAGGLAMIGVAWFIVSIIFFVIKLATT